MTVNDLMSVASGSGGGALISAAMIFFVKRMLQKYDEKSKDQYDKLDNIKDDLNDLKVQIGIISTQVEGLVKQIDNINTKGCNWCRVKKVDD